MPRWPHWHVQSLALLWLLVAASGEAQTLHRLGTGTFPSPAVSRPAISAEGRVVLVDSPANTWAAGEATARVVVVLDRQTGAASLQPWTHPSAHPLAGALSSSGQVLAYGGGVFPGSGLLTWTDLATGNAVELPAVSTHVTGMSGDGRALLVASARPTARPLSLMRRDGNTIAGSQLVPLCTTSPFSLDGALSDDGQVVASLVGSAATGGATALGIYDVARQVLDCPSMVHPDVAALSTMSPVVSISGDGAYVAVGVTTKAGTAQVAVLERASGAITVLSPPRDVDAWRLHPVDIDLSGNGRYLVTTWADPESADTYERRLGDVYLTDRTTGITTLLSRSPDGSASRVSGGASAGGRISANGRHVVFTSTADLLASSPSIAPDPLGYVVDLDSDGDLVHDAWETAFGLNPADSSDAALDPDGDGQTNAQEYAAGTHPRGTPVRYFAEGAQGSFFSTSLALFNPLTLDVTANVRFLGPDGATVATPVVISAGRPSYLDASSANLPFTEFSLVVESPSPLVAERRMVWDRTSPYGSHSGAGVATPATAWHFAEGATIAGMQTFLLLQNPGDAPAMATMRYLLPTGAVHERVHQVPARSRVTVWVNQEGAPLDAAEFSTSVTSDQPLVAERAMYRDAPGAPFGAGSVANGVTTPVTFWFFAEGSTGAFFDTYLLLANPGAAPATVDVEFFRAHDPSDISTASTVFKQYELPPHSRRTIWGAQEDESLRSTQVGARMVSDVPIVAERTMWWPGPTAATWRESHAEAGSTQSGLVWAIADIQADAEGDGWDTFILVATTVQQLAQIRVAVACDDGATASRDISLSVNRTTLWMRHESPVVVGRRCAATIESLPTRITLTATLPLIRTPLVVESATYLGTDFRAGGVTLATRLPDPP